MFGDTVYHPGDVARLTSGNHGIIVHIMKRESGVKSLVLVFAGRCDRPKSRVIRFEDMELIKFPEWRLGPVQRSSCRQNLVGRAGGRRRNFGRCRAEGTD